MGLGGISIWQLLIVLAIVVLIFGTKRLKGLGSDLGNAVKGFKDAIIPEDEAAKKDQTLDADDVSNATSNTMKKEKTEVESKDKSA